MAWPASLPAPLLSSYSAKGEQPVRRTKMEVGLDRVQRISSSSPTNITMSIALTTEGQRQDLLTYYNVDGNAGANMVTIPIDTGLGFVDHSVRFLAKPIPIPKGKGIYFVNCPVETLEQNS